jgi:hypothetical protein
MTTRTPVQFAAAGVAEGARPGNAGQPTVAPAAAPTQAGTSWSFLPGGPLCRFHTCKKVR